jgi:radical SAM superfamily enzyme YgiQ (UPF0313 family)
MSKALLIVPHFWDPVCVPLGISSLKAYAEQFGHCIELFDFNTLPDVFGLQRTYFEEGKRQFPVWKQWNIERNGTEMLALHQLAFLYARNQPDYPELVAEILNMNGQPQASMMDRLNIAAFDGIFSLLYGRISNIVITLMNELKPEVVGCSLFNSTWPGSLFILKRVKGLMPWVRTIVGGPGPLMGITSRAEEVQTFFDAHDFIDYFVVGEGERPFVDILDNRDLPKGIIDVQRGESPHAIKKSALRMDELPLPDYGSLDVGRYLQLSISSSRGCPFECSFCAETIFWKGFRTTGKSVMYDRVHKLAQRYKRTSFYLCDSLANQSITTLTSDIASSGSPYTLDCYLRADPICTDENRTRAWRAGGLARARLGMESASQRVLDAMIKMTNPENMAKCLHALANQGIMTSTLWIVCYPGETESEFEQTLDFIRQNRSHIYQADAWLYQYHPEGLAHSSEIDAEKGSRRRFSDKLNKLFAVTPYVVQCDLSAAERFDRLERFVREMEMIDVPNPYSLYEWLSAEGRWKSLGRDPGWSINRSMMINA